MDAKQMAGKCGQMMAGQPEQGGKAGGMREHCGKMAAMCGGDEASGMLKHCEQLAAQFADHGETAEAPEQSDPEGPQFA